MKILASVCGIGLGHSTRVFSILEKLKKKAKISLVASNKSYDYLKSKGYKPQFISDIDIRGDEFTVDTIDSLIENLDFPIQFAKNYSIFSNIIEDFKPDVILCDTEPSSFFMSRFKNVKLVCVTNYISSADELRNLPNKFLNKNTRTQFYIMQKFIDTMVKYSKTLNISIEQKASLSRKIVNIGLLMRKQPDELHTEKHLRKKLRKGEFYLVSFGGSPLGTTLLKPILKSLKKFKDKKFIVSSSHKVDKTKKVGNITIVPFLDNYLEYLKVCRGVISLAGFSTISETLAFRKPSMVIPIRNHIEQLLNANILKRLQLAETCFIGRDFRIIDQRLKSFFIKEEAMKKVIEKFPLRTDGAEQAAMIILSMKN